MNFLYHPGRGLLGKKDYTNARMILSEGKEIDLKQHRHGRDWITSIDMATKSSLFIFPLTEKTDDKVC
jgi:hypothetical protein